MYVGITQKLISEVQYGLERKQLAEANTYHAPGELKLPTTHKTADLIWGPHLHLRDLLPDEWKIKHQLITLVATFTDEAGKPQTLRLRALYSGTVSGPPQKDTRWGPSTPTVNIVYTPEEYPELIPFVKHYLEMEACRARWTGVIQQLTEFLNRCKSVNEALKLWPECAQFLPQSVIDKASQKIKRGEKKASAAEDFLKTVDKDAAVTANVIGRLAEAQNKIGN